MSSFTSLVPRRDRPLFDGQEECYEQWEKKFIEYMTQQGLHNTILPIEEGGNPHITADENGDAFAELALSLDDRSLSLVVGMKNYGREALQVLRSYYACHTSVVALYMKISSLKKQGGESLIDFVLRVETAAAKLRNAGEIVSDCFLIAIILKGLPPGLRLSINETMQSSEAFDFTSFKSVCFEKSKR